MKIITRFAPSPTGLLHIGSARTALFNWLYARHTGGQFLLRIEDTDKERSTLDAINAITDGMKWLNLNWDGEVILQSQRWQRHQEIAYQLLAMDKAYYCYSSQEEIAEFRIKHPHQKFHSPWRDKKIEYAPHLAPVVRLRAPKIGHTTVGDTVKGVTTIQNTELDDMILLRSDGTPTYMLAVVVDDYDMGITHIIRGDDHFTNTFRQRQIIDAMQWPIPNYTHIPLIHGADGSKLSKRHGALGIQAYKDMGYLPEAINNYLLRLGWSCGDEEIINTQRAIELFSLEGLGKSPARFDYDKLNHINAHYISTTSAHQLLDMIAAELKIEHNEEFKRRILEGMHGLKARAKTLVELYNMAKIYVAKVDPVDEKSAKILSDGGTEIISKILPILESIPLWSEESLEKSCREFAMNHGLKPNLIMQILRAGVIGTFAAPGVYEVAAILGKQEVLDRIKNL